jgi:hypothetical protein
MMKKLDTKKWIYMLSILLCDSLFLIETSRLVKYRIESYPENRKRW